MDILFADKPAGVTTHSSGEDAGETDGFQEYLSLRLDQELFVVHRLDRDTSGALIFAKTKSAAAEIAAQFADRSVKKSYLFLTDADVSENEFTVESNIERVGNSYVSKEVSSGEAGNALTHFRRLKSHAGIHLWQAEPQTGKTHQIRLHAAGYGLPIMGDEVYDGSYFPTLCLHSASLTVSLGGESYTHRSTPPKWMENLELALHRKDICRWLAAIDRRERISHSLGQQTLPETIRLVHSEGDPLRIEKLGDTIALYWFQEEAPTAEEWRKIRLLIESYGWQKWFLQMRGDRGRDPNHDQIFLSQEDLAQRWVAKENEFSFQFRRGSGLSAGLFLDQRRNRKWVHENAQGLKVLNLFCYTGGFSVAAALGGAQRVTSVDLSRSFLEWSKENFNLNGLDPQNHDFKSMDARDYARWAQKKGLTFDLIICDPPSFSRSDSGVFRIEKDFAQLFNSLLALLAPRGQLLFATNFEKFTLSELQEKIKACAVDMKVAGNTTPTPGPDWDFELPFQHRNMKSMFFRRK